MTVVNALPLSCYTVYIHCSVKTCSEYPSVCLYFFTVEEATQGQKYTKQKSLLIIASRKESRDQ